METTNKPVKLIVATWCYKCRKYHENGNVLVRLHRNYMDRVSGTVLEKE